MPQDIFQNGHIPVGHSQTERSDASQHRVSWLDLLIRLLIVATVLAAATALACFVAGVALYALASAALAYCTGAAAALGCWSST